MNLWKCYWNGDEYRYTYHLPGHGSSDCWEIEADIEQDAFTELAEYCLDNPEDIMCDEEELCLMTLPPVCYDTHGNFIHQNVPLETVEICQMVEGGDCWEVPVTGDPTDYCDRNPDDEICKEEFCLMTSPPTCNKPENKGFVNNVKDVISGVFSAIGDFFFGLIF
jgi:hypothetical protein